VDESTFRNTKLGAGILVIYKAFSDLAAKGLLFVVTIVAARRLSPQAFGIFSLASTLGWMLAVAADFGIQLHVARSVARAPENASDLLDVWLRIRLWTTAGAILVVAIGLAATRATAAVAVPMLLFAFVYGGSGLVEFLHYFYRGLSRSDVESSLTLWQRSATLLCAVPALLWRPDVSVLAGAMLLPVAGTLAASVLTARRLVARGSWLVAGATNPLRLGCGSRATSRETRFLTEIFPIGAGIVLSALYFRIDVFLVQLFRGTEAVARYSAVFRLVEALRLFPAAVLAVALPWLCRARDVRPLVRLSIGVTVFGVAATVVLQAAAGWIVPLLYGAPYAAAVPAFRILALALPLLSLNYALTHQLIAWDGQRAYATICGLALVVNVALNTRLIPAQSIEGAAWATVATEVFVTAGCVAALRGFGVRPVPIEAVQGVIG
jgi:O-antigen/teichoic acid export membrane protein